jgi:hypothetical protein
MSLSFNAPGRRVLATGFLVACLAPGLGLAQPAPTPTPNPDPSKADAPKPAAPSGVMIRVGDTANVKFGLLLQPQADWTQSAPSYGYVQNLFIRRARFLVGGQMAKNLYFFWETENSRLGQATATTGKSLTSGFQTLDAAAEWRPLKEFNLQAGLIRVPTSREALKSAATSFALDTSAYAFTATAAAGGNAAGRDTGVMARGFFANDHFEYRFGGFQGSKDSAAHNSLRWIGRVQYNLIDTEPYAFPSYSANNLATKRIIAFGAALDTQKDYKGLSADMFVDYALGAGALLSTIQYQYLDGGTTFSTLARSNVFTVEAGYYCKESRLGMYGRYEQREYTAADDKNERRALLGVNYYPFGSHNLNLKAAYGVLYPPKGSNTRQFTIQLQAYYF